MSRQIQPPAHDPDPLIAQVIDDVNAVAGEYGKPAPYFAQQGIDFGPLAAAVWPRAQQAAESAHRAMVDDKYGIVPEDHLAAIIAASIQRGIAYGLELAKRRNEAPCSPEDPCTTTCWGGFGRCTHTPPKEHP